MKGRIGYEIFPDRFCSASVKNGTLDWSNPPVYSDSGGHQYDFYGGDLNGITGKLDYLDSLNVDFIYLTPIFSAKTNHRYDCTNFFSIDEMLGNDEDFERLADEVHKRGMRIVLDAVFNHISIHHPWCEEKKDFILHDSCGPTHWCNVPNLPELNLENGELRKILWLSKDSAVDKWTDMGTDDWRFDCAYELGFEYLREITAHLSEKGDHETYGEIWSYPGKWVDNGVLTGVMNYYYRELINMLTDGEIDARLFMNSIEKCVKDCTADKLIKSWNVLSSHDTERIRYRYGKKWKNALCLQFTLPGSPLIYYGEEIGLVSANDPHCRQPMPWHEIGERSEELDFFRKMTAMYRENSAINSGGFETLDTGNEDIIAFSRFTEKFEDYTVVVLNNCESELDFSLISRESKLMNHGILKDLFSENTMKSNNSILRGKIGPNTFGIYQVETNWGRYSPYKRIR